MLTRTVRHRLIIASAAALAIAAFSPALGATKKWDGGAATVNWLDAGNWDPDGVPGASDAILLDNSLVGTLPSVMNLTDSSMTVQTFTWNSPDPGDLIPAEGATVNGVLRLDGNGVDPLISVGPLATGNTVRLLRGPMGTGTLGIQLGAVSAGVHVDQPGATLRIGTNISEASGGTRVVKTGAGLFDISGFTHTFTGGVQINGGTVHVTGTANLGTTPSAGDAIGLDGGALRIGGAFNSTATARGFTLGAGGGTIDITSAGAGTISGPFTGPGRLHKTGAGTLWVASGASNFTGGVHILGGTMRVANATQLGALPAEFVPNYLQIDGGTLLILSSTSYGSTRGVQIDAGGATINMGPTNSPSFLGVISGVGGLTKVGDGTLTLGGDNTFDGPVNVNAGMLVVEGNSLGSTAAGTVVAPGAAIGFSDDVDHTSPEPLTVSGAGPLGAGAIENLVGANRFAGPVTLADNTTVGVTADSLTLAGGVAGSANLSVTGAGTLSSKHFRVNGLTVSNARTSIEPGRSTDNTSVVKSLTLGAANQLNLNDQDLVVDYSVPEGGSPYTEIRDAIKTAYAAATWIGPGLTSDAAAASGVTGLGYAEASSVFTSFPATFSGQEVDATSVLVRYTRLGDANLDGVTNIGDFSLLGANFNQPGDWVQGDFNYDGLVNIGDFSLLAANFNESTPSASARAGAVPEPASAVLLVGAGLFARRRHRD